MAFFRYLLLLQCLLHVQLIRPAESHTTFVFGDSLVDAGNNNYLFTISKADSPPYGIDFAPSGGRPTGRFTNGRTVSDIVVQALGSDSFPPPYLSPNASGSKMLLAGGINYASGSSGILDGTGASFIGRIPMRKQVDYFEETRDYLVMLKGGEATEELLEKAVFTVTTGSNDILNYLEPSIESWFGETKPPPSLFYEIMLSNLTQHLKRLHSLGARKLVVVGVGPLGCIPYLRSLKVEADGGCWGAANGLIRGYNAKLRRAIGKLNQEMSPGTTLVYANSFDIVIQIIENYTTYGFKNAEDPCCGLSFPPLRCFGGNSSSGGAVALCSDRDKYVFWDAYHPTDAANVIIANRLLDGGANDAYPINIRELYTGASS